MALTRTPRYVGIDAATQRAFFTASIPTTVTSRQQTARLGRSHSVRYRTERVINLCNGWNVVPKQGFKLWTRTPKFHNAYSSTF